MHDFHPGRRDDIIEDEEFDEVQDILEFLGEQSEVNNILGEQRILIMNDSSDDDVYEAEELTDSDSSMSGKLFISC